MAIREAANPLVTGGDVRQQPAASARRAGNTPRKPNPASPHELLTGLRRMAHASGRAQLIGTVQVAGQKRYLHLMPDGEFVAGQPAGNARGKGVSS